MIIKTAWLACGLDRAFELFTEHASEWWPAERRHTGDPASAIIMRPPGSGGAAGEDPQGACTMSESGRFYERGGDGREVELGRVRAWQRPTRLELDWYPGTDAAHPTAVTVTFAPDGDGTLITIEHAPTAASRDLWSARAPRYDASWDLVLAAAVAFARR